MTSSNRNLQWTLGVKDDASAGFKKVGDNVESMSSRIGGAIGKVGGMIGGELGEILNKGGEAFSKFAEAGAGIGTKLAAAGVGIAGLGVTMQAFASGENQAHQQLKASIAATGDEYDVYEKKIEAAISKGEDFGHSGADVQNALAKIVTVTGDTTKALSEMGLVEDVAAFKHISLAAAADQVDKMLQGNVKTFKQYGVILDTTLPKQDAIAQAMQQVADKLKGQASAASDTFMGKLDALKAHATDFAVKISNEFGPAFTYLGTAMGIVGTTYDIIAARSIRAGEAEDKLTTSNLAEAASAHAAAEANLENAAAQDSMAGSAGVSRLAGVGATVGVLAGVAAIGYGGAKLNEYLERNNSVAKAVGSLTQNMNALTKAFQADGGAVGEQTAKVAQSALQSEGLAAKAAKAGISMVSLSLGVTGTDEQFKNLIETWKASGSPSSSTLAAVLALRNEVHSLGGDTADLTDNTLTGAGAMLSLASAVDETSSEYQKGIDKINAYTGAMKVLDDQLFGTRDAELKFLDAVQSVTDSFTKNGMTLDVSTQKGRDNYKQVEDSIKGINDLTQQYLNQGMTIPQVNAKLAENEAALLKTAGSSQAAKDQISYMIAQMALTPDKIETQVIVDDAQALSAISTIEGKLNYLAGLANSDAAAWLQLAPSLDFAVGNTNIRGTAGQASGGMVGAASGALFSSINGVRVNEFGSELLDMGTGRVYPHNQSEQMKNNAGGGSRGNIYVTVNVPAVMQPTQDTMRAITAHLETWVGQGGLVKIANGVR